MFEISSSVLAPDRKQGQEEHRVCYYGMEDLQPISEVASFEHTLSPIKQSTATTKQD